MLARIGWQWRCTVDFHLLQQGACIRQGLRAQRRSQRKAGADDQEAGACTGIAKGKPMRPVAGSDPGKSGEDRTGMRPLLPMQHARSLRESPMKPVQFVPHFMLAGTGSLDKVLSRHMSAKDIQNNQIRKKTTLMREYSVFSESGTSQFQVIAKYL